MFMRTSLNACAGCVTPPVLSQVGLPVRLSEYFTAYRRYVALQRSESLQPVCRLNQI